MRTHLLASAVCLWLAACAYGARERRVSTAEEGALFVYIEPQAAAREGVEVQFGGLSAVRGDGSPASLELALAAPSAGERRERLLAWGPVPAGPYAGLAIRVASATLRAKEGTAALFVPEEPLTAEKPFEIAAGKAVVLRLGIELPSVADAAAPFRPSFSVTLPERLPLGLLGLVTCRAADALVAFDKVSGRVGAVVLTGRGPAGLALDAERGRAYVALSGEDAVEAVDLLDFSVLARVRLTAGDEPADVALAPDGRTILTANRGSGTVSLVDAASFFELRRVRVGDGPDSVVVDRAGRQALVVNTLSNTVTVLDLPTGEDVATIATDAQPFRAQPSRDGSRLYVIHRASPYLDVLDLAAKRTEQRVWVGLGASALKVDPVTDRIYLASADSTAVAVYDPLSLLPVDSVPAGGQVGFLAIDGEGNNLCMTLPRERQVRLARLVSKEEVVRTDVLEGPYEIALQGER